MAAPAAGRPPEAPLTPETRSRQLPLTGERKSASRADVQPASPAKPEIMERYDRYWEQLRPALASWSNLSEKEKQTRQAKLKMEIVLGARISGEGASQ